MSGTAAGAASTPRSRSSSRNSTPELSPELGEEFARECETLCSITHPHLLIFYGAGETAERKPFMVTEFMEGGSLRRALADHSLELSIEVRLQIGQHIALAMEYLHGIQIVHRDLKSDNCLLDAELNAKVADFGTSKFIAAPRGTFPNLGSPASPASNGGSAGPAAGPAASALTRMSHPNRPEWRIPRDCSFTCSASRLARQVSPTRREDEAAFAAGAGARLDLTVAASVRHRQQRKLEPC